MFNVRIHKTVYNTYNIVETALRFTSKKRKDKFSWLFNEKKLENNISRAKSNIFNIVSYNKFEFFYTQTISSLYARSDLKRLISKFNEITRNLRKKFPEEDFYYLVIPEYHSDKQNWHLHGFLSKGYGLDSYVNDNGFLSVSCLDKIGWNSISPIKNYQACSKYITKYITKESALDITKGDRLFYCSQKLNRSCIVNDLVMTQIAPIHFDFKNEYVFKTSLTENKYYNFITNIDNIERLNYYIVK